MRALIAGEGEGELELADVDEPKPRPEQALVEVRAASLNRGEVRALQWAQAGWHPGWDISGVIAQAASDGTGPSEGTRVVGLVGSRGWAERVAVSTSTLADLPAEVAFESASTLPVAGLTARRMTEMMVIDGRRVAITGAAGGVGRFAVQLAAQNGAYVTAIVGSEDRSNGLKELGASEVVVGGLAPEGEQFALVLESAGGESLAAALHRVAPDGMVVSYGNSSGEPTTFDVTNFYGKSGARLYAFVLFPELQRGKTATVDLRYLANLVAIGHLDCGIDRVVDWSDLDAVRATADDLLARRIKGKAVLAVGG